MDCQWSPWTVDKCSVLCGIGTQRNTRTKILTEQNGGMCLGEAANEQYCKEQSCQGKISLNFINLLFCVLFYEHIIYFLSIWLKHFLFADILVRILRRMLE